MRDAHKGPSNKFPQQTSRVRTQMQRTKNPQKYIVGGRIRANLRTSSTQIDCSLYLGVSLKVNQSAEQVDCYAQLSTNIVDLKFFMVRISK
jgi:hypothetical protein